MQKRCPWSEVNPKMIKYHDEEWGVPLHDDKKLFEFLVLDAFQAGLSWATVLNKRENFRTAFDDFDPVKVATYTETRINELIQDACIIRNRQKITAAITNAIAFLEIQKEFGSFDKYIWQFTANETIRNCWNKQSEIPAKTDVSDRMSKDLQKRGFKFVGSTICYAFMQAAGMVNDHLQSCARYNEV